MADHETSTGVPSLIVDDVHVHYTTYGGRRAHRLRGHVGAVDVVRAVRGVSFVARHGESIGVIGHNGSGKSTLLRAIAGALPTASGAIWTHGNAALLGVSAALMKDLSGERNIVLGGLALGLTRREVDERFDEVVEFAGIGDFLQLPMRAYSSGMGSRLRFAISSASRPDILLIDEALATGDAEFKARSRERVDEIRAARGHGAAGQPLDVDDPVDVRPGDLGGPRPAAPWTARRTRCSRRTPRRPADRRPARAPARGPTCAQQCARQRAQAGVMSRTARALVMTVVHHPEDARIRHRQIDALLSAGWEVTYAAPFAGYGLPAVSTHPRLTVVDLPRALSRSRVAAFRAARALLEARGAGHDVAHPHRLRRPFDPGMKSKCDLMAIVRQNLDTVIKMQPLPQHQRQRCGLGTKEEDQMKLCLPVTLLFTAVFITGCLFPAALGTMGAVGSDAPVVWNHWGAGQGERFCLAAYSDVIDAALRAGEALSLEVKEKKVEKDQAFFRFVDAENEKVDLYIRRRSNTMTSIRFDVGWFGPTAFGRLVDQQIVSELNKSNSFLSTEQDK